MLLKKLFIFIFNFRGGMGMFSTVEDLIDTSAHVTTFMLSVHLHAK